MNFVDVVDEFKAFNPCTDAFVYLKESMQKMLVSDPENAAVYFFLYEISLSHHRYYEDQAVSPEFSLQAKTQMEEYLNQLLEALNSHSKDDAFSALSAISHDYVTGHHVVGP